MAELRDRIKDELTELLGPTMPKSIDLFTDRILEGVLAALVSPETVEAVAQEFHAWDREGDSEQWNDERCNDTGGGGYESCKQITLDGVTVALTAARDHLGGSDV